MQYLHTLATNNKTLIKHS